MLPRAGSTDGAVICACGSRIRVADLWLVDSLTCGVCGRKVHVTEENVFKDADKPPSALIRMAERAAIAQRHAMAIDLVRQGKYDQAIEVYESVLAEKRDHRDALYGVGFCHYKKGNFTESYRLISMAAAMGHAAAERLLPKVREKMQQSL